MQKKYNENRFFHSADHFYNNKKKSEFNNFGIKPQIKNNIKNRINYSVKKRTTSFNNKNIINLKPINNINFKNISKDKFLFDKLTNKNKFKFGLNKDNNNFKNRNNIKQFKQFSNLPNIKISPIIQPKNNFNKLFLKNNIKDNPIILKHNLDIPNKIFEINVNNNNGIKLKLGRPNSSNPFRHPKLNEITKPCANGLINIGATCYMNATLQCLAHIQKLTKNLLNSQKKYANNNNYLLTNAYIEVLKNIWQNKTIKDYSPNNFKNLISVMNPLFAGIQANDSKDLILYIMETLHNELNIANTEYNINNYTNQIQNQYDYKITFNNFANYFKNNYNSIISHLFYGMYNSKMQCLNCNIITHNIQCFHILIFPLEQVRIFKNRIQNEVSIIECFEYYQKNDYMVGENQIFCNNCHTMSNSMNISKIIISPNVLVINLNRGKGLQYDVKLSFEEILDISNFVQYNESPKFYELIGIVTHFGPSDMSGHFIAFCKSFVDYNWYKYNDAQVTISSFEEARNTGVPYILIFSYMKG